MTPDQRKRALSAAILLVTLLGGYASASKPKPADVKPAPGYVQLSNGKMVDVTTKSGCFIILNPQLGRKAPVYDPTDGAVFCER